MACARDAEPRDDISSQAALEPAVEEMMAQNGESLVYELRREKESAAASADATITSEVGELDAEAYQKYARPSKHQDSPDFYTFTAWQMPLADGAVEQGVRVTKLPNPDPEDIPVPVTDAGPPELSPAIEAKIEAGNDGDFPLEVWLTVSGYPDWDVPLLPPSDMLSAEDYAAALQARADRIQEREELFVEIAQPVESIVVEAGGAVLSRMPNIGVLLVEVDHPTLSALAARNDLTTITGVANVGVGLISQGDLRVPTRMSVQDLWDDDHVGEQANGDRHGFNNMTLAITEPGAVNDEACMLKDGANCTGATRLKKLYRCDDTDSDGNWCETVSSYPESLEATHANTVTSVALADYLDGQGTGFQLGDPAWTSGDHSYDWKNDATAMAPEAALVFFAAMGSGGPADAVADLTSDHVDVYSTSMFITDDCIPPSLACPTDDDVPGSLDCNERATDPMEKAVENFFDDGGLPVALVGNLSGPSSGSCEVYSPADIPKCMAISGLNMSPSGCASDYNACRIDTAFSARGGATVVVDGVDRVGTLSIVDGVVPQRVTHFTNAVGTYGEVVNDAFGDQGTSHATPRWAGMSLDAKDWFIQDGQDWINDPGWLYVYMRGMFDRHSSAQPATSNPTQQMQAGASAYYGLGKPKMRHFGTHTQFSVYGHYFTQAAFTGSSSDYTYLAFNGPMPTGTEFLKCVTLQHEDMSGKTEISSIGLYVAIRNRPCGTCSCSQSVTPSETAFDYRYDTKKMVAFSANQGQTLANKCAYVTLVQDYVPDRFTITTQTFCYLSDLDDDEPN